MGGQAKRQSAFHSGYLMIGIEAAAIDSEPEPEPRPTLTAAPEPERADTKQLRRTVYGM